jgi:predicted dehydrogenase
VEADLKDMYMAEFEDFIDTVENRRKPMNSGEEALKNFTIIQAAYKSQKAGKVVKV